MTTRRVFLGSALVAASVAALPRTAFGQSQATAAGLAQAKTIEYQDGSHGIVLTERDRVTRDLQAFIAS
jgi:hypothetical protein